MDKAARMERIDRKWTGFKWAFFIASLVMLPISLPVGGTMLLICLLAKVM